jgi:hypothetical protein
LSQTCNSSQNKKGEVAAGTHLDPLVAVFFRMFAWSTGDIEATGCVAGAGRTFGACISDDREEVGAMRRGRRRTTGTTSDAAILHGVVFNIMGSSGMCNLQRRGCMVSYTDMIQEGGGDGPCSI